MTAKFEQLEIPGAFIATPAVASDTRGEFYESWRMADYSSAGVEEPFMQDNISVSRQNVLRAFHYQVGNAQGQMVTIVRGRVMDVLVDLRRGSPMFGKSMAFELDELKPRQLYMPPGVAHGFYVLSSEAVLHYKCTRTYDPAIERGVRWNDPQIGVKWPVENPTISPRDGAFPLLSNIALDDLPTQWPPFESNS